jgi:hypothetical protein
VAESNETYSVYRGDALPIGFTFFDANGDAQVNTYGGSEPLSAAVWPGGNRAASFAPAVAWDVAAAATGRVTISAAQTSTLDPGDYQLVVRVTTADGLSVAGYSCKVVVLASAGTAVEPPTYCSYDELLKYARGWLKQLANDDDESRFRRATPPGPKLDRGHRPRPFPDGDAGRGGGGRRVRPPPGLGPLDLAPGPVRRRLPDAHRPDPRVRRPQGVAPRLRRPDRRRRGDGLREIGQILRLAGRLPRLVPGAVARHRRRRRVRRHDRLHLHRRCTAEP